MKLEVQDGTSISTFYCCYTIFLLVYLDQWNLFHGGVAGDIFKIAATRTGGIKNCFDFR